MAQCTEQTASLWQWLFTIFKKKHNIDKTREAKIVLQDALDECHGVEQKITNELMNLATQVRDAQKRSLYSTTKQLLLSSRSKRVLLSNIQKRRNRLLQQQETLNSCELNTKVISSMKQTSAILKDVGINEDLKDVDETMYDLQENMEMANQITNALGETNDREWDDIDVAKELEILLEEKWEQCDLPSTDKKDVNTDVQLTNKMMDDNSSDALPEGQVKKPSLEVSKVEEDVILDTAKLETIVEVKE